MSKLISGKDVVIAILSGKDLLWKKPEWEDDEKEDVNKSMWNIEELLTGKTVGGENVEFYLKPRTVTLNGIEFSPCVSIGICRIKNEVSIQLKDESDADKLYALLTKLFGFRG